MWVYAPAHVKTVRLSVNQPTRHCSRASLTHAPQFFRSKGPTRQHAIPQSPTTRHERFHRRTERTLETHGTCLRPNWGTHMRGAEFWLRANAGPHGTAVMGYARIAQGKHSEHRSCHCMLREAYLCLQVVLPSCSSQRTTTWWLVHGGIRKEAVRATTSLQEAGSSRARAAASRSKSRPGKHFAPRSQVGTRPHRQRYGRACVGARRKSVRPSVSVTSEAHDCCARSDQSSPFLRPLTLTPEWACWPTCSTQPP